MDDTGTGQEKLNLILRESLAETIPAGGLEALELACARFRSEIGDPELCEWLFERLPEDPELFAELSKAVKTFYIHPAHAGLGVVLKKVLRKKEVFSPRQIRLAIEKYISILTEELFLSDKTFRKAVREDPEPRITEIREHAESVLLARTKENRARAKKQTPAASVDRKFRPALAAFKKMPLKTLPDGKPLPEGSRFQAVDPSFGFFGREKELKQIAAWLVENRVVVIGQLSAGVGGMGKSQLAAEFSLRYGQYFLGGVYWLSFTQEELIPAQVAACGTLAVDSPLEARVHQMLEEWRSPLPRLIIFDNVEEAVLVEKWLPPEGGCRILVTTRSRDWKEAAGTSFLALGPLEVDPSAALLGAGFPAVGSSADLSTLASNLQYLPLALHLAQSLMRSYSEMGPAELLNALEEPRLLKRRWLEEAEYITGENELVVMKLARISLNFLNEENELDRRCLSLLKWLARCAPAEPVPIALVQAISADAFWADSVDDAVTKAIELGLVEKDNTGALQMHPLLRLVLQTILADRSALPAVENSLASLAGRLNAGRDLVSMQALLPQLAYLTDKALTRKDVEAARLANELGFYLDAVSSRRRARFYYEQSLAIHRKVLGEEHPDTAVCLNNLGSLLRTMGDYRSARSLLQSAAKIRRRVLGEDNPDTAVSFNNLGYLLQSMGEFAEARPCYEQALKINRKLFGDEAPSTLDCLNNIGYVLLAEGRYEEARQYYHQVLEIRRKKLGKDHPQTAASLNAMGLLYQAMGNFRSARSYYEKALSIYQKIGGEENAGTAASLNNLGFLSKTRADLQAAREYYEKALAIRRKVLGEANLDTAVSLSNLGSLLEAMEESQAARPYLEQALVIRRQVLGEDHPETLASANALGQLLERLGDREGARPYLEKVRAIQQNEELKQSRRANRAANRPAVVLRTRIISAVVFSVSLLVIGYQIAFPGTITTKVVQLIATVGNQQPILAFHRPTPIASKTLRPTFTSTRTPSPTATSTRRQPVVLPSIKTPTWTKFNPNGSPTPTKTLSPIPSSTNTLKPTLPPPPPTHTFTPSGTPTPHIPLPPTDTPAPTDTITPHFTLLPTDTPESVDSPTP